MNIIVFGATGTTGSDVVDQALAYARHRVVRLNLSRSACKLVQSLTQTGEKS